MPELFERWKKLRDAKNEANRALGTLDSDSIQSAQEATRQAQLVQHYNDLYAEMYRLQEDFTDEDWAAYDVEQDEIRQSEYQSWLIENRYGNPNPPRGIADWLTK